MTFIKENVTDPLTQLLQLFPAPFRLIQKRNDKCLDYDRAKNKAQKATDTKERDKINQVNVFLFCVYLTAVYNADESYEYLLRYPSILLQAPLCCAHSK